MVKGGKGREEGVKEKGIKRERERKGWGRREGGWGEREREEKE